MRIKGWIKSILRNERAATAIEYGLILALLTIAIIGSLDYFAAGVNSMYNHVQTSVEDNI